MENGVVDGRWKKVIGHWSLVVGKMIGRISSSKNSSLPTSHASLNFSFLIPLMAILFAINGCGYKPAATYARAILPDPVYVDVKLSGVEPQNGVYLKDEILRVLKTHFHQKVVSDRAASVSQIIVPSYAIDYSPLAYDDNGYVTRYRVKSKITFELHSPKGKENKTIETSEDVSIQSSSLTSSAAREVAIRVTIRKAMDRFIAWVAQKGYGK